MPPKRKVETVEDKTKAPPAKKTSEEETPTISPDEGATGETATSSKTTEAEMQTGWFSVNNYKCGKKGSSQQQWTQQISSINFFESEEEKEADLLEVEWNAILGMLNSIKARDPEAYQDIIIGTLYKHFARENRATRSKEAIFSELDKLESLETEHWETSGRVPDWLKKDMEYAREDVEFENYVTLLKEARAHFGLETACVVILYIDKHKGERYCMNCMSLCHKEN